MPACARSAFLQAWIEAEPALVLDYLDDIIKYHVGENLSYHVSRKLSTYSMKIRVTRVDSHTYCFFLRIV